MSMVRQYFSWGLPAYSQGPGVLARCWSSGAGASLLLSTHKMLLPLGNLKKIPVGEFKGCLTLEQAG